MARLPIPGNDDGTWGSILNDFLAQAHNTDGSLKPDTVAAAQLQDGSVAASKLDSATQATLGSIAGKAPTASPTFTGTVTVPVPVNGTDATTKSYVDSQASAGVPDATTTVKGKLRLANDLAGTADNPQVTATHLSTALPVAQGGTGATTQNFVDLATAQTISGAKTFSSNVAVPGGTVMPLDWINVRTYGATGNGSTDDLTAIQNAIAACPAGDRTIRRPKAIRFRMPCCTLLRPVPITAMAGTGLARRHWTWSVCARHGM